MNLKRLIVASVALAALSPGVWADDVTDTYLTNAGFDDESSFVTADVAGNTSPVAVAGWSVSETGAWSASATFALGSGLKLNNASVPATDVAGRNNGGVLGLSAGWGNARTYKQSVTLPAGLYTISYAAYNGNSSKSIIGTNKIGFVPSDGSDSKLSSITNFPYGEWMDGIISFELNAETSGDITVGFAPADGGSDGSAKLFVDYIRIYYSKSAWGQAVDYAKSYLAAHPDGADAERTAVLEKAAAESGTDEDITELNGLLDTFLAAVDVYEYNVKYADEIAEAEEIEALKAKYPYSYESILPSDFTSWTGSNKYVVNGKGQHWDGSSAYYESNNWNDASWNRDCNKTVSLPNGKYLMTITERSSSAVVSTMSVKVGDDEAKSITLPAIGGSGKGIDLDGKASYAYGDNFANGGAGYGWKYSVIEFEVTEGPKDVAISFASTGSAKSNYVSIANPVLYGETSVADVYKVVYLDPAIETAEAVDKSVNTGEGAFKRSADAFTAAIAAAKAVRENADVTAEGVQSAVTALNDAVTAFANAEVSAPEETAAYNIVLNSAGWKYDGKAVNAYVNSAADGGYSLGYNYAPGATNYSQSIYFKKVDGVTNGYTLSFVDADGATRYVCTAKGGGYNDSNTAGIRTTTDEAKALTVKVIPSTTADGIYQLYNTEANNYIGSQDAGFYTVNSHATFNLTPAAEKEVTREIAEGKYGTIILPYAAQLPEGAVAYSVKDIDSEYVNLEEVTGNLEANKPYIIGAGSYSFSGLATALNSTYADNNLTGVLEETAVPEGSYVLQTSEDVQAFYVVEGTLKLAANRAYLTLPTEAEETAGSALRIGFGDNTATGISAVEALTSGKAEIYDLNGRKLNALRKGINIVNGVKVLVK